MDAEWPATGSIPVGRADASTVELDDNVAVYDEVGQLLILLNSSAAAVWRSCDGKTSVGAIVEALAAVHPDDAEVIGEDVRQTLRKLAELGLVSEVPNAPNAPDGPDTSDTSDTSGAPEASAPFGGAANAGGATE